VNPSHDHILEAAGLRVRFFRHADRYAHEIWLCDNGRWRPALASIEGTPEEDWPASPPFQSLDVEQREGRPLALLVGMAGASHWSASVQIDPLEPCLHFDVAARVRGLRTGPLGSAYRAAPDWSDADPDGCPLAIELSSGPAPALVEREGPVVRIAVAASTDPAPRTIRWAYRLRPISKQS
jgi:hypothetical protein